MSPNNFYYPPVKEDGKHAPGDGFVRLWMIYILLALVGALAAERAWSVYRTCAALTAK